MNKKSIVTRNKKRIVLENEDTIVTSLMDMWTDTPSFTCGILRKCRTRYGGSAYEVAGLRVWGISPDPDNSRVVLGHIHRKLLNEYAVEYENERPNLAPAEILGIVDGYAEYDQYRQVIRYSIPEYRSIEETDEYDSSRKRLEGELTVGWVVPDELYGLLGPLSWKGEDGKSLDFHSHVHGCELHELFGCEYKSPFLATREEANRHKSVCGSIGYWAKLLASDHPAAVKARQLFRARGMRKIELASWPRLGKFAKAPEKILADALHLEATAFWKFGIRVDFCKAVWAAATPGSRRRKAWILAAATLRPERKYIEGREAFRVRTYRETRQILTEYASLSARDSSGGIDSRYNPTPAAISRHWFKAHAAHWVTTPLSSYDDPNQWGYLVRRGTWTYHSTADSPAAALDEAVSAFKRQRDEDRRVAKERVELMAEFQLPTDRSILVSREDSYAVGNCESGTRSFIEERGFRRRTYVGLEELLPYVRSNYYVERVVHYVLRRERQLAA
ncbi:MAG: hypothetical protein HGA38_03300 [Candidatus Moranbacteria bacterium]|nr:hypothetical protein [Candidatus Moranbacteria bacterium]